MRPRVYDIVAGDMSTQPTEHHRRGALKIDAFRERMLRFTEQTIRASWLEGKLADGVVHMNLG